MTAENRTLAQALSDSAKNEDKSLWLACFDGNTTIPILHNDDTVSCSFGTTGEGNSGFWKYNSQISIMIEYEGWFGHKYKQPQELFVRDSGSFTVRMWG